MGGLKGDEDLGGELHAVFNLENMFTSGTGMSDGLFNRYAVAGLSRSGWGTILFGRAMSLTDGEGWAIDPTGMQAMGLETPVYGRNWGPRSNTVTFNSANFGGFGFRLQSELCNQAGNFRGNRQLSGSASYSNGTLDVHAVYEGSAMPTESSPGFIPRRESTWSVEATRSAQSSSTRDTV
jgi:predicted porin